MADSDDAFQILIISIILYPKGLAQGEQGLLVVFYETHKLFSIR